MADGAKGADEAVSFTGGCQCGAVRYRINADRLVSYACHCRECQKQSASAFGISVPVFEASIEIEGATEKWQRQTDSGSTTDCYFCPRCGSRIYHDGASRPGMITIKGGSLDNAGDLRPVAHIWTKSQQKWFELPNDVPAIETQPETNEEWLKILGWAK